MECCFNDLGNVAHNSIIDFGMMAEKPGEHTFRLNLAGAITYIKKEFELGDDIVLDAKLINENAEYQVKVLDPDNEAMVIDECDTFIFRTFVAINHDNDGDDECNPDDDPAYLGYGDN